MVFCEDPDFSVMKILHLIVWVHFSGLCR